MHNFPLPITPSLLSTIKTNAISISSSRISVLVRIRECRHANAINYRGDIGKETARQPLKCCYTGDAWVCLTEPPLHAARSSLVNNVLLWTRVRWGQASQSRKIPRRGLHPCTTSRANSLGSSTAGTSDIVRASFWVMQIKRAVIIFWPFEAHMLVRTWNFKAFPELV